MGKFHDCDSCFSCMSKFYEFKWHFRRDFSVLDTVDRNNIGCTLFSYKGFSCYGDGLISQGWQITLVTNRRTLRHKLYFRHPELKLIGRCTFTRQGLEDAETIELDFLMQEHNGRTTPPKLIYEDHTVKLDNIGDILSLVNELQQADLKPKPKPKAKEPEVIAQIIQMYA